MSRSKHHKNTISAAKLEKFPSLYQISDCTSRSLKCDDVLPPKRGENWILYKSNHDRSRGETCPVGKDVHYCADVGRDIPFRYYEEPVHYERPHQPFNLHPGMAQRPEVVQRHEVVQRPEVVQHAEVPVNNWKSGLILPVAPPSIFSKPPEVKTEAKEVELKEPVSRQIQPRIERPKRRIIIDYSDDSDDDIPSSTSSWWFIGIILGILFFVLIIVLIFIASSRRS